MHNCNLVEVTVSDDDVTDNHPVASKQYQIDSRLEVAQFKRLSNALFSPSYSYTHEKSDNDIYLDILYDKYVL